MNVTPKRISFMNSEGYGLVKMKLLKIRYWFSISAILVFEKRMPNAEGIEFDTSVYYTERA